MIQRLFLFRTLATAIVLSSCFAACGEQEEKIGGDLAFELTAGPDVRLGTVNYAVSGNGFMKNGTIDASASSQISGRIGGIPSGQGFALLLTATAANDPGIKCEGKANFNIAAGAVTQVFVNVQCRLPAKTGTVVINGKVNVCPIIDAVDVLPAESLVGGSVFLKVQAHDTDSSPAAVAYAWTSTVGAVTGATLASASTLCSTAGSGTVTVTVTDGDCSDTVAVPVLCTPLPTAADAAVPTDAPGAAPAVVKVNEVESNAGVPGDWVELYNAGSTAADLSSWVFKDNDDTHVYTIPSGTTLAPGAFLVIDESSLGFGLGGGDSARVFDNTGTLVDSYTWTAHAAITYARCPDGFGAFASSAAATKGSANNCGVVVVPDAAAPDASAPDAGVATLPWPGPDNVVTVDELNQFGDNLSGLHYEDATATSPTVLWGVLNSPSLLYRLLWNGSTWASDPSNGWMAGKTLRYPSGTGNPDSEGVTRAEAGSTAMYVSTERNNDASSVSRLSILRVDTSAAGIELVATNEWNINADLPVVGANLGLEAITWIPDAYLVANGLRDQNTNLPYNPGNYANHGTGLFFVGVEGTGMIHAYALDHSGSNYKRIASFSSGQAAVMDLAFDRATGALWSDCDNTCGNTNTILGLVGGDFVVRKKLLRPTTLPDSNNEGITFAPESACVGGTKPFFWSDDSHFAGHALRQGFVNCGPLF